MKPTLNYARLPDPQQEPSSQQNRRNRQRCGAISLTCGTFGIVMNVLLIAGVFARPAPELPLLAVLITAILPIVGILFGLIGGVREGMAVTGLVASAGSLLISIISLGCLLSGLSVG